MVPDATAYIPLIGSISRWHGDVDAIERAFILRAALDEFVFSAIRENQRKKKNKSQNTSADDMLDPELIVTDELSEDDWEDLKVIQDIPSPFKVWSLQLQGLSSQKIRPNGFGADVIPAMDELLSYLEEAKHNCSDESVYSYHIISSIHIAWSVLNKYYSLVDNQPALYVAVALHLDMKLKYFCAECSEHQDCIDSARSHCTMMWDTEYRHLAGLCDVSPSQSTTIGALPMPPPPEPSIPQWRRKGARLTMGIADINQMQLFQSTPEAEDVTDLIHYWPKRLNSPPWSQLACMALNIHSIPAMSSEVERVFSSSKLLISDCCNCLGDAVISAVE